MRYSHLPHFLRLAQDPQLTVGRRIRRHNQPALRIPSQARRPEATAAKARSVTLTLLNLRVIEDILGSSGASERLNRRVVAISAKLELHATSLKPVTGTRFQLP